MHDPLTVAFEIKKPWGKVDIGGLKYREPIVTVWHKDPEWRGDDDSCDWWGWHRPLSKREAKLSEAVQRLLDCLGNPPYWPEGQPEPATTFAGEALVEWRRRGRFRLPVRWHIWHWRIQVIPFLHFKRWAFSRCAGCDRRFKWGYAPTGTWSGPGQRWFRNEPGTYHGDCYPAPVPGPVEALPW